MLYVYIATEFVRGSTFYGTEGNVWGLPGLHDSFLLFVCFHEETGFVALEMRYCIIGLYLTESIHYIQTKKFWFREIYSYISTQVFWNYSDGIFRIYYLITYDFSIYQKSCENGILSFIVEEENHMQTQKSIQDKNLFSVSMLKLVNVQTL